MSSIHNGAPPRLAHASLHSLTPHRWMSTCKPPHFRHQIVCLRSPLTPTRSHFLLCACPLHPRSHVHMHAHAHRPSPSSQTSLQPTLCLITLCGLHTQQYGNARASHPCNACTHSFHRRRFDWSTLTPIMVPPNGKIVRAIRSLRFPPALRSLHI